MKNSAGIDESVLENYEELLSIGLTSSADIFSKLLNSDVEFWTEEIIEERVEGLTSFGDEAGLVVTLECSGALTGRAVVVIQNYYAKNVLNVLMSGEGDDDADDEIDEIAMGTFKELVGQMASAFADSMTNFFGSTVNIETTEIYDLSEECDEISDFFECDNNTEIYSIINGFDIKSHFMGTFNLEVDKETFNDAIERLNVTSESEVEEVQFDTFEQNASKNFDMPDFTANTGSVSKASGVVKNSINVQSAQFPSFANQDTMGSISLLQGNMDLLMDVPLNVTIEIGKTRKKMRDIMEFAQGTVIDLEKQAGAPVDIVVNGQLIARGDVVVIDDNFGVRITEIIGNNNIIPKE